MKNQYFFFSFLIFIVLLLAAIFSLKNFSAYESTDNAYIRGSITSISSRIDGYVTSVPGVINTRVNKGDILVKFDQVPLLSRVKTAKAQLKAAKAKIVELDSMLKSETLKIEEQVLNKKLAMTKIDSATAKKDSEYSNLVMFENEKNRIEKLLKTNNTTKSKLEKAVANYEVSKHKVQQYTNDIKSAKIAFRMIEKQIKKLEINLRKLDAEESRYIAQKEAIESQLETILIDLESTNIKSPIDGIIANRIVEPGVYMKNGWPLMSVVPVEDVWLIANFKETQIKNLEIGMDAEIKVDAFSKHLLKGKILSLSPASASSFSLIPPQNASGNFVKVVQRIPVKILIDLPEELIGKIVPGLSAHVKINTSR